MEDIYLLISGGVCLIRILLNALFDPTNLVNSFRIPQKGPGEVVVQTPSFFGFRTWAPFEDPQGIGVNLLIDRNCGFFWGVAANKSTSY